MSGEFQPNFTVKRLYCTDDAPVPVIKVGILPFVKGGHALPPGSAAVSQLIPPLDTQGSLGGTQTGTASPPIKILTMKPSAEAKHLGAPLFQIAKGTRRININGNWCDMREDDLRYADESFFESLIDTALREGAEEIGLRAENISTLYDMGCFTFTSASRGIAKPIHMFAAQIIDENNFDAFEETTQEVRWLDLRAFGQIGRKDHHIIVEAILKKLAE